jgi:DNA-binding IclR family transcriptional regulator
MSRAAAEGPPELQLVLDALDDPDCRRIIRTLDEPKTAAQVSEDCDIPTSTTYRKLDLLSDASLLAEGTEVRPDGHHATRYEVDFERVVIELDEAHELDVSLVRPAQRPDERLASLWSEVRKES